MLNQTFVLLSSDYSKSLHLQTDRFLEFHTPGALHYTARIPRYGRDLKYNRRTAEALVPAVGVNADGNGEVFRLNLEVGRFMRGYEIDVGGDDMSSMGGGALQGGIRTGAVNCVAIAEESHGMLAFGTSLGTVELWDTRSQNRISALRPPASMLGSEQDTRPEITALDFHNSGLQFAAGSSNGLISTYDLRSSVPLLRKEQGYDYAIQTLKYLTPSSRSSGAIAEEKILSADKRSIKLWDSTTGDYWTSIEPAVDLSHVEWVQNSGMFLTANEGRQQHAFFIPQLGPAPKWCSFLDNLVEEMAEDADDPNAFKTTHTSAGVGEVYDNYKFLDMRQLRELSLDHLVGETNLLRPYMHGYFVAQKLYEQARLLTNPDLVEQQRHKSIQERVNKERESRIRGNKKVTVKVNRKLAEKLAAREEANERRKAQRVLKQGGDEPKAKPLENAEIAPSKPKKATTDMMADERFGRLFEDEEFQIDETSREFALHNPPSAQNAANGAERKRGLTAVEEDELDERHGSSDDEESPDEDEEAEQAALRARQRPQMDGDADTGKGRIGSASYKKAGKSNKFKSGSNSSRMQVSSSTQNTGQQRGKRDRSFGDLASSMPARDRRMNGSGQGGGVVGEKEISFAPSKPEKKGRAMGVDDDVGGRNMGRGANPGKDRRSASGNVFRRM